MRYLVYYVAAGQRHWELFGYSMRSLFLNGYEGAVHVHTDVWPDLAQLPGLVTVSNGEMTRWDAMRAKAAIVQTLDLARYAAVLFLDADTLINGDLTPMLDRIAAEPAKLFLPLASGCSMLGTNGLRRLLTPAERDAVPVGQPMLDSYAVGFVPTARNLAFLAEWDRSNDLVPPDWAADAFGLNIALLAAGRLGDVEVLTEAERLNGRPSPGTVIEHYVHGAADRMPAVYRKRFQIEWSAAQ